MKSMGFPNQGIVHRMRICVAIGIALAAVLAVFPNTALSAAQQKDSPSLAIFPFYLPGVTETHAPLFVGALYDVLEDTRKFTPKYSWYAGDGRFNPDPLKRNNGLEDLPSRVWKQDGDGPKDGPDEKAVFEVGGRLGVDAVILYAFHVSGYGNDLVRGYLFDVTRQKVFTQERKGKMVYVFTGEILKSALTEWLHDVTRELFRMEEAEKPTDR